MTRSQRHTATNAARAPARDAKAKPRDLAGQIAAKLREDGAGGSLSTSPSGFIRPDLGATGVVGRVAHPRRASASSWRARRRWREGRCRICLGESHRPDDMSATAAARCWAMRCAACAVRGLRRHARDYINDAGAQVDALARSAFLRYREALGEEIGAIPEGLYPGDYLKPVGQALAARNMATGSRRCRRAGGCRRARGHRDDDGPDQGDPRSSNIQPRRVFLGAAPDRNPATTSATDTIDHACEGRRL